MTKQKSPSAFQRLLRNGRAFFFYSLALIGVEYAPDIDPVPISSQNQLERLLAVEKEELGCTKNIVASLVSEDVAISRMFSSLPTEMYLIELGGTGRSLPSLQHELYHICDEHFQRGKLPFVFPPLNYFFWEEPQAALYAATGLQP